jgi:hypothetical protein
MSLGILRHLLCGILHRDIFIEAAHFRLERLQGARRGRTLKPPH